MKKLLLPLIFFLSTAFSFAAVNINTASESQLISLSGIGPAKAKAIIQYRDANGAFKTTADIQKVNGIGPAIFERIQSDITIDKAPEKPAAAKPALSSTAK